MSWNTTNEPHNSKILSTWEWTNQKQPPWWHRRVQLLLVGLWHCLAICHRTSVKITELQVSFIPLLHRIFTRWSQYLYSLTRNTSKSLTFAPLIRDTMAVTSEVLHALVSPLKWKVTSFCREREKKDLLQGINSINRAEHEIFQMLWRDKMQTE